MNKLIITFLLIIQHLYSVGVIAGTEIKNIAYLDYKIDSFEFTSVSNELIDIVDQKIDMQMTCNESDVVIVGVAEEKRAMAFILTNTGNGEDIYTFTTVEGDTLDFQVNNAKVYVDNGDGIFSIATDTLATEVTVASDANISLFLVADIPDNADKKSSNGIQAISTIQGSLLYGESKKLNDFYAVIATMQEAKKDFCTYEVSPLALTLEKTATFSSDKAFLGSTIHYKIDVNVMGAGRVENVVVNDDIPLGTIYVPSSLKLDGVTAGDFNGSAISVALNPIVQTGQDFNLVHTVTFDVKIQE
jgi:uncharacterized repeat protein (TIGR01451 family)